MHLYYFGNISYWAELLKYDSLSFISNKPIPKKSYTNRCNISTANGVQSISIPIQGGRGTKILFSHILISYNEKWIEKHKMALQSAYSKSPFYEYFMPYFESILDRKYEKLIDLNLALTKEVLRILKLKPEISLFDSSDIHEHNHVPDLYTTLPIYPQVFRYKYEFQPDLSILDLLFNQGNQSLKYLQEIE